MPKFKTIEKSVLSEILNRVNDCLIWDEDLQLFVDNGDFLASLNKEEREALRSAINKI